MLSLRVGLKGQSWCARRFWRPIPRSGENKAAAAFIRERGHEWCSQCAVLAWRRTPRIIGPQHRCIQFAQGGSRDFWLQHSFPLRSHSGRPCRVGSHRHAVQCGGDRLDGRRWLERVRSIRRAGSTGRRSAGLKPTARRPPVRRRQWRQGALPTPDARRPRPGRSAPTPSRPDADRRFQAAHRGAAPAPAYC